MCCDRLISIIVVLAVLGLVCSLVINILVRLFCAWEHLLCSITQYGGGGSCPGHNSRGPRGNYPITYATVVAVILNHTDCAWKFLLMQCLCDSLHRH